MQYLKSVGFIAAITFLLFLIACGGGNTANNNNGNNNNGSNNNGSNNGGGNNNQTPGGNSDNDQPATFAAAQVFPSLIVYDKSTTVTAISVFSNIGNSPKIELLQLNGDSSTSVVGQLLDDGSNGDKAAGDGIFTFQLDLNPTTSEQMRFQISAANGSSSPTVSRELTVTVVDGPLPPDPGEAGKQTLEGIDSDKNGLRDDVQRYIAMLHPESQKARMALQQTAILYQNALLSTDTDNETAVKIARQHLNSFDCMRYVLSAQASENRSFLSKAVLNTVARRSSFYKFNDLLGGQMFGLTPDSLLKSTCSFVLDELEN